MVRLVLFDIDGTLILSGKAGEKAFERVCDRRFNVPGGTRDLNFAGRTDPSIVRDFFTLHGIEPSPQNFEAFFNSYLEFLGQMLQESRGLVLPGIASLIRDLGTLPKPPKLGLLTGNIRPGARLKLSHYNLWDHFETGAFGDDHEDRNQVAVIARDRAVALLGTPLHGEEIVVIGDTPRDVLCARAIDARCLAVATGSFSRAQLEEHAPTWTVGTVEEIPAETLCR
jgi:phosphoglycolate phosphatase-like HAD superfamily hydrolase